MGSARIGRSAAVLLIALITVTTTGCGDDNAPSTFGSATTTEGEPVDESSTSASTAMAVNAEFQFLATNALVHLSHGAVIATVHDIGGERWNSIDGRPWDMTPDAVSVPTRLRDVTVVVDDVLYASDELAVRAGDQLVVTTLVPSWELDPSFPLSPETYDGAFSVGSQNLLVLSASDVGYEDRIEPALRIAGSWQGNWSLEGDVAVSIDPERTVDRAALTERLVAERDRGPVELSESEWIATSRDPLGGGTASTTVGPGASSAELQILDVDGTPTLSVPMG